MMYEVLLENLQIGNIFLIPLCYCYKGSTNCKLLIEKNISNLLILKTQYGEIISENITILQMHNIVEELSSGKYA